MRRVSAVGLTCSVILLALFRSTAGAADAVTTKIDAGPTMVEQSAAQNELDHVFLIKARFCRGAPAHRLLTGFRVRADGSRPTGIVTALHGIAGCRYISALNFNSGRVIMDLQVRRVSVPGDLALLSTDSLDAVTPEGFVVPDLPARPETFLAAMRDPRVAGHPYGQTGVDSRTVEITRPPMHQISNMLTSASAPAAAFINRRSPDASRFAVSVTGPVARGHSGAPLYTGMRAVAVISGGQLNLPNGKSWAIPLWNAQWTAGNTRLPPAVQQSLDTASFYHSEADSLELKPAALPPRGSVTTPVVPRTADRHDALGRNRFIRTTVNLAVDGTVQAHVSLRSVDYPVGFCAASAVVFFDGEDKLLWTLPGGYWCVDGKMLSTITGKSQRDETYGGSIDPVILSYVHRIEIIHQVGNKNRVGNEDAIYNYLREQRRIQANRTPPQQ